jgi:S1-C subfamily serine protease
MKNLLFPLALLTLATPAWGDTSEEFSKKESNLPTKGSAPDSMTETTAVVTENKILDSFVRVNATIQTFDAGQPWERNNPARRSGLGTVVSPTEILTTAEMVANQTYLELESADSASSIPAKVLAIDYKANLALLAPENPDEANFLAGKTPLEIAPPAEIGDEVTVWQFESNGITLKTTARIRAVETYASFLSGYSFLSYVVKGSMQSASSSFTLPVTRDRKLLGVLTTYDSDDQISQVITPEILSIFLRDARDGDYQGFPSLGVASERTDDRSFRAYLDLSEDDGGLYISKVKPGSPADEAGVREGDVILAANGMAIDRKGYFDHPSYGPLPWTVLIRAQKTVGETLPMTIFRDGEKKSLTATLKAPEPPLVPRHLNDSPPPFLIKGGLVFQELSRAYLEAYGDKWTTRAPLALMDVLENEDSYREGRDSVVFLSRVIPNPATIGYDDLNGEIVNSANGEPVTDIAALAKSLSQTPENGIHTIELDDDPGTLYLDARAADAVDQQLLRSGLPSLSRLPGEKD